MCGLTKGLGQLVDQSWSVLEGELEGGTARRFLPQTENDDGHRSDIGKQNADAFAAWQQGRSPLLRRMRFMFYSPLPWSRGGEYLRPA